MSERHYGAQAFWRSQERYSGQLKLSCGQLCFEGSGQRLCLPLVGLTLRLGGAANRLVWFEHPDQPDWSIYSSDRQILDDAQLQHASLLSQLQQARRQRWSQHWPWLVLIVLLLLPLALLVKMDWFSSVVVQAVPKSWEVALGKAVLMQYRIQHEFLESAEATASLGELTQHLTQLRADSGYQYHFYILNSSELNAFALPGGTIVIHSGLILAADNASELLGVLAHEMAHVEQRHGTRNLLGSVGVYLVVQAVLGDVSGIVASLASLTPLLLNQSYSRDFEREADASAVQLLLQARISPQGLIYFFEKLQQKEQQQRRQLGESPALDQALAGLSLLASHPATAERIATLKQIIPSQTLNYLVLDNEFQQLKQQVINWTRPSLSKDKAAIGATHAESN